MLTIKKLSLLGVAAAAVGLLSVPVAQAETFSDTGAAVLVWPKIVVDVSTDTVIQLTNQNVLQPSAAHCFYVNANSRCTNTGEACLSSSTCFDGSDVLRYLPARMDRDQLRRLPHPRSASRMERRQRVRQWRPALPGWPRVDLLRKRRHAGSAGRRDALHRRVEVHPDESDHPPALRLQRRAG